MTNIFDARCPVCKRSDERVKIVYVPAGHGRYCEYVCCECKIVFPWGSNKFGDITSVDQIKYVAQVPLRWEGGNMIDPKEHDDFEPIIECARCSRDITRENRRNEGDGWVHSKACPGPEGK